MGRLEIITTPMLPVFSLTAHPIANRAPSDVNNARSSLGVVEVVYAPQVYNRAVLWRSRYVLPFPLVSVVVRCVGHAASLSEAIRYSNELSWDMKPLVLRRNFSTVLI